MGGESRRANEGVSQYTQFGSSHQTGAFIKKVDPKEYFDYYIGPHNKVIFSRKRDTSDFVIEVDPKVAMQQKLKRYMKEQGVDD